jgi:hypothetical protein
VSDDGLRVLAGLTAITLFICEVSILCFPL